MYKIRGTGFRGLVENRVQGHHHLNANRLRPLKHSPIESLHLLKPQKLTRLTLQVIKQPSQRHKFFRTLY